MASDIKRVQHYRIKIDNLKNQLEDYKSRSKRLSFGRLLILIVALILVFALGQISVLYTSIALVLSIIIFIYVVRVHDRINSNVNHTDVLLKINENEISALDRFGNEYYDGEDYLDPNHLYSVDLDVFGPFSLFGLINRCRTYHGNFFLQSWFSGLDSLETINERTNAVKELEKLEDWRQKLFASLYAIEDSQHINYAVEVKNELGANLNFTRTRGLNIYRKLVPYFWIGLVILGIWDTFIASRLAIILGLLNIAIAMKFMKPISQIQNSLSKSGFLLDRFMQSLHCIMSEDWKSPYLQKKVGAFESNKNDSVNPIKILSELKKILDQLDYRLNIIAAFLLNALVLWDLIIIDRLATWQKKNIDKIDQIFNLIGFFESISSLANWSENHPEYTYTELDGNHYHLEAQNIRHPLIKKAQNVANDFNVADPGRINIITGSNMSGKSTFLRTIGTNLVLAYAGTKVAADHLSSSHVQLMSYMRIKDALEENVSTFKAELNRVELMLELVSKKPQCLILIDEMLRGTNSKDKLKGSINITKKLIESEAYVLIATHDIKLAELSADYPKSIRNYYFDIDFENGDLKFDYKIKDGICENFNASFLLKQIGIG